MVKYKSTILFLILFFPLLALGQQTNTNGWYVVDSKNCTLSSKVIKPGVVGNAQSFRIDVTNPNDTAFATFEKKISEIPTPFSFKWWWNLSESTPSQYYVRYQFYIGNDTKLHQLGLPYQSDMIVGKTWWYSGAATNDPISGAPSTMNRIRIRVYSLPGTKTQTLEWLFDEWIGVYGMGQPEPKIDDFGDSINVVVSVKDGKSEVPNSFKLFQNYPNPFNPTTSIKYEVSSIMNVKLAVYDILGREVTRLVNEVKYPGKYSVQFNGSNLPSGIYFYRLIAVDYISTKKMQLMK